MASALPSRVEGIDDNVTALQPEQRSLWDALSADPRFSTLLTTAMGDVVVVTDEAGTIVHANAACERLLGWNVDELVGTPLHQLVPQAAAETLASQRNQTLQSGAEGGAGEGQDLILKHADGRALLAHLSIGALCCSGRTLFVGLLRDQSQTRTLRRRTDASQQTDALTELLNRDAFLQEAQQVLERHHTIWPNQESCMVVLNINRFRDLNEQFGMEVGDQVLKVTAERIASNSPGDTLLGRLSADEFAVVVSLPPEESMEQRGQSLLSAVSAPINGERQPLIVSCSVGVAALDHHGEPAQDLVSRAQIAVRMGRRYGGSRVDVYTPEMDEEIGERIVLTQQLQQASSNGQLYLDYQPIVEMSDKRLSAAEALIRWSHPSLGRIPPDKFIPLAEEEGLIEQITDWVLDTVMEQIAAWGDRSDAPERVFVNCPAGVLLSGALCPRLASLSQKHGIPLHRIGIEITEQTAMQDVDLAAKEITALSDLGISVALDDFGTGFSSLAYLQKLPIRKLKIDRSFVLDLPNNARASSLCQSIVGMSKGLGLEIVAEGIETDEQLSFLRGIGCDYAQGYLLGRPGSPKALTGEEEEPSNAAG